jgi:SAM-dependent methyltransferase
MQALRSPEEIREVNTRYHDIAAPAYDSKWGIDFGETGQAQVLGKLRKLLAGGVDQGTDGDRCAYPRALEVGAGTGYFGLNLVRAGVVGEVTCTDISAGMISALRSNARRLGLAGVRALTAEAAALPFDNGSFDLVFGHAVLHHLPDLERAFTEFHRVLVPGGRIAFAGEPSAVGDRLARIPKRAAWLLAPAWRAALRLPRAEGPGAEGELHDQLERRVDIHSFRPPQLGDLARRANFVDVRVEGEELTANWFGWFNRGLEARADGAAVPMLWRRYAFHGYLALQRLDSIALEPHLPAAVFYNLMLTGRRRPA